MAEKAHTQNQAGGGPAVASLKPTDLPAPPQEALAIMRACASDDYDAREVADLVANDPVLTAELLRLVNSAFFGLSREVSSVTHAVAILGQRALRNLVLCIAVRDVLARNSPDGLDVTGFWEDSLRRAAGARLVGIAAGLNPEECFTAGLLQDFGLLGLFHVYPDRAHLWEDLRLQDPLQRLESERTHFGTTHEEVLGMLAQAWSLPKGLADVLGHHHRCAPEDEGGDGVCGALLCADWIAAVYSGADTGGVLENCRQCLGARFGFDHDQADELLAAVPGEVDQAAAALGLRVRHPGDFDQVLRQANARLAEENLSFQEMTWELRKALKERDRLAAELDRELVLAGEIQQSLLPTERSHGAFPVFGINLPARELSGDFYDYFALDDGRVYFNLADVSGKGITAALLMAKASSLFHCLGKEVHAPGQVLARVNEELCETSRYGMFVTMVAGLYDPDSGRVQLVNAGHPPALLLNGAGAGRRVGAHGPPLGIQSGVEYTGEELVLDQGCLYLFSDGVTETLLDNGRMLGVDGLENILQRLAGHAPEVRLRAIVKRLGEAQPEQRDDVTLLLVEGNDGGA